MQPRAGQISEAVVGDDSGAPSSSDRSDFPNFVDFDTNSAHAPASDDSIGLNDNNNNSGNIISIAPRIHTRIGWGASAATDADDVAVKTQRLEDDPAVTLPGEIAFGRQRWTRLKSAALITGVFEVDRLAKEKTFGVRVAEDTDFAGKEFADKMQPEVKRYLYVDPDGGFRSGWDLIQVVVLFYLAWVTPYRVAFDAPAYGYMFWFEFIVDTYFIFDVFLNFCTGFWKDTELTSVLVSEPWPIARNYLTSWFLIDITACLPIDLATRGMQGELACSFHPNGCTAGQSTGYVSGGALKLLKLLRIFRLVKLLRLFRVSRLVHRYQNTLIYYHSFISVVRVNLLVILMSHWLGCLYGLTYDGFDRDDPRATKWLLSVYWAVQSITSVGYGDLPATNVYSQVVAIATMLVGVVLCSWIMTNVLSAMNPDSSARRFRERLQYVLTYLKSNQLPNCVAKRVITFYRWQNMNQFDEKSVLADLPVQLRKEIFDNLYANSLDGVPIFKGCSIQFMTEVCLRMSPISYPQFHPVYCQGELGVDMYFITKGSVAVILDDLPHNPTQEQIVKLVGSSMELGRGSFFGETAVLHFTTRLETCITTRSSNMLTLRDNDMEELCQLSSEFKAELMTVALERMRRNRVALDMSQWILREMGLDPNDILTGEEKVHDTEASAKTFLGRTTQVKYVPMWKEVLLERVRNSAVASVPKIFSAVKKLGEQADDNGKRIKAMEQKLGGGGGGAGAAGAAVGVSGNTAAGAEGHPGHPQLRLEAVEQRLRSLEDKLDTLIALQTQISSTARAAS